MGIIYNVMAAGTICYIYGTIALRQRRARITPAIISSNVILFREKRLSRRINTADIIIATYIIFSLLPSVVFLSLVKNPEQKSLLLRTNILYLLGFICDALLHCLSKPETRRHVRLNTFNISRLE